MVTGNFHYSCDVEVYKDFQSLVGKGNVTKKIQEFMENFLLTKNENLNHISMEKVKLELEELTQKQAKMAQKRAKMADLLQKMEQKMASERVENLKNEEQRLKNLIKCVKCGQELSEQHKSQKMPAGLVCKACFLLGSREDFEKWKVQKEHSGSEI